MSSYGPEQRSAALHVLNDGSRAHIGLEMLRFFGRPVGRAELREMNPTAFNKSIVEVFRRSVANGWATVDSEGRWAITPEGARALDMVRFRRRRGHPRCEVPDDWDDDPIALTNGDV